METLHKLIATVFVAFIFFGGLVYDPSANVMRHRADRGLLIKAALVIGCPLLVIAMWRYL